MPHLLAVLVIGLGSLIFVSSVIPVNKTFNDGKSNVAGVYLAKGSDDSGSSGGSDSGSHDSSKSSSSGSSSSENSSSGGSSTNSETKDINIVPSTTITNPPKIQKIEKKEVKENPKVEIKTREINENHRTETKSTSEKIKSEIRQGNLRVKFEIENGKVKIETKVKTAENEAELEDEAEDEAVKEVEKELEKEDVKIATAPGQMALVNKRVGALSNFPISIDPTTRQLTVTTPSGSKVVAVLPQQAIDNMLASRIMDDVINEKVNNNLAGIPDLVKLETENGILGYKVKGTKNHRLLGFIPIKTGVEAFVSAENGQVVESKESLLGRILNRIAP